MEVFKHVQLLQSDGGPEFKGEFRNHVLEYADYYRESRAYRKNEQSFIESFNRTLRKECLGWRKYELQELTQAQYYVNNFLQFYHEKRPHLGLKMRTPSEFETTCRI